MKHAPPPKYDIRPYDWSGLAMLDETFQTLIKGFAGRAGSVHFIYAETQFELVGSSAPSSGGPDEDAYELTLGPHTLTILIQGKALVQAANLHGFAEDIGGLDRAGRACVAKFLFGDALSALTQTLGFETWHINPADPGRFDPAHYELCFQLRDQAGGDTGIGLTVYGPTDALAQLARCFPQADTPKTRETLGRAAVEVSIHGPSFQIARSDMRVCEAGAGFVLDLEPREALPRLAVFGTNLCARVARTETGYALAENPLRCPKMGEKRNVMSENADIGDALVTVTVELLRTSVRLRDLENLSQGSVVPIENGLSSMVRLLADGIHFADGELVRVGDKTAVHILRCT
jgi:flagellar motor switch/type III secretory pathway protein FliN